MVERTWRHSVLLLEGSTVQNASAQNILYQSLEYLKIVEPYFGAVVEYYGAAQQQQHSAEVSLGLGNRLRAEPTAVQQKDP